MAKQFFQIEDQHKAFIEEQHMFFVGTAARDGRVNISPKGMDSLRVMGPNRIVWLNMTGSGNESATHLMDINRMTVMWCSFTKKPVIMRAYGSARTVHEGDDDLPELAGLFGTPLGARQVFEMSVDLLQTSCGFAVPFMDFVSDRDTLSVWTANQGEENLRAYRAEKNLISLDGKPTDLHDA